MDSAGPIAHAYDCDSQPRQLSRRHQAHVAEPLDQSAAPIEARSGLLILVRTLRSQADSVAGQIQLRQCHLINRAFHVLTVHPRYILSYESRAGSMPVF